MASEINVVLKASTGAFAASMAAAGNAAKGLTSTTQAYKAVADSIKPLKLAGTEIVAAFKNVLASAQSELKKFANNKDVQVAVEFGREQLDEAWIKARAQLQRISQGAKLHAVVEAVADKAHTVAQWLSEQKARLAVPLMAHIQVGQQGINAVISSVKQKLASIQQSPLVLSAIDSASPTINAVRSKMATLAPYMERGLKIALAAKDGVSGVAETASKALGPLVSLAASGVVVALRVTAAGVATAVAGVRTAITSLIGVGHRVASEIGSAFSSLGRLISSPLGLIGLGGGVAGIGALIKDSMQAIEATAHLSDRLGITTQKLTGLQYAAKQAGVETDELTNGLEKMLRNSSEANNNPKGPQADAFARLKIDPKELVGGGTNEAIEKIADGLKGITNPAERAQAAVDIFGKAGQKLLPLMLEGSAGIKAAQAEAQKLGLTFSRVDAAKVELANQAFRRMQAVIQGAVQTLSIQLAPYIEALGQKITDLATKGGGVGTAIAAGFQKVVTTVAMMADGFLLVRGAIDVVRAAGALLGAALIEMFEVDLEEINVVIYGINLLIRGINKVTGTSISLVAKIDTSSVENLKQGFVDTAKDAYASAKQEFSDAADGKNSKAAAAGINDINNKSQVEANKIATDASQLNGSGDPEEGDGVNPGTKSLKELQDQLESIRATTAQGINPKFAQELAGLHLNPEQSKQWVDLKEKVDAATKAFDDAAEATKKIGELKGEIAAAMAGKDADTGKSDNPEVNSLTEQLDLIKKRNELLKGSETPMQKFQDQLDEITKMNKAGLLTLPQFDQLTKKATDDFGKGEKKDGESSKPVDVKAETSRSEVYLNQTPKGDSQQQILDEAKKQTSHLEMVDTNLNQLYVKFTGLQDPNSSGSTYDIDNT